MFYVCCRLDFFQYQPQSNKARKKQNNTFTFLNFSSVQIYLIRFLLRYDGIKLNHIAAIDRKFRARGVFCVSDEIPYRVGNIRPFRNRVTMTRRIKKLFLHTETRRINGESPVSRSETDKKRSSYKISPIRFGAANRNCKEQNDNHTQ